MESFFSNNSSDQSTLSHDQDLSIIMGEDCISEFKPIKLLGSGSQGAVVLARSEVNGGYLAMKLLDHNKRYQDRELLAIHRKNIDREIKVLVSCPAADN